MGSQPFADDLGSLPPSDHQVGVSRAQALQGTVTSLGTFINIYTENARKVLVDLGEVEVEGDGVPELSYVENVIR